MNVLFIFARHRRLLRDDETPAGDCDDFHPSNRAFLLIFAFKA